MDQETRRRLEFCLDVLYRIENALDRIVTRLDRLERAMEGHQTRVEQAIEGQQARVVGYNVNGKVIRLEPQKKEPEGRVKP